MRQTICTHTVVSGLNSIQQTASLFFFSSIPVLPSFSFVFRWLSSHRLSLRILAMAQNAPLNTMGTSSQPSSAYGPVLQPYCVRTEKSLHPSYAHKFRSSVFLLVSFVLPYLSNLLFMRGPVYDQKRKKSCNTKWCYSPYCFCTLNTMQFVWYSRQNFCQFQAGLLAQASLYRLPSHDSGHSDILDDTLPLQRRYRAGFTPASLLAHAVTWEHEISCYSLYAYFRIPSITPNDRFVKGVLVFPFCAAAPCRTRHFPSHIPGPPWASIHFLCVLRSMHYGWRQMDESPVITGGLLLVADDGIPSVCSSCNRSFLFCEGPDSCCSLWSRFLNK